MVSNEPESNYPNSDTDEDSVTSTQHTYGSIDEEDEGGAINDNNESVTLINEEN